MSRRPERTSKKKKKHKKLFYRPPPPQGRTDLKRAYFVEQGHRKAKYVHDFLHSVDDPCHLLPADATAVQ